MRKGLLLLALAAIAIPAGIAASQSIDGTFTVNGVPYQFSATGVPLPTATATPTATPTDTPTPTATATATATPTPTATATATPTATPTPVPAPNLVVRAQGTTPSNAVAQPVTIPSPAAAGNVAVAWVESYNLASAAPPGWSTAVTDFINNSTSLDHHATYFKILASGDIGTPISFSGPNGLGYPKVNIRVYGNASTGPVVTPQFAGSTNATTTSLVIPAMTATTVNNETYALLCSDTDSGTVMTPPTDLANTTNDGAGWATIEGDKVISTSGPIPGAETCGGGSGGMIGSAVMIMPVGSAPAPTPTPTPIAQASPVAGYATTWLANSIGRPSGFADIVPDGSHVQQAGMDMTILSDGTEVVHTKWDEGHVYTGLYKNGAYQGILACDETPSTGTSGGGISNNGTYIFATQNNSYNGSPTALTNYLGRWNLNGTAAGFSGGVGNCSNLIVLDNGNGSQFDYGVAANGNTVWVTDPNTNTVRNFNATTMAEGTSFAFSNPRKIAYDPNTQTLWISQGTTTFPDLTFQGNVFHYSTGGTNLNQTITSAIRPTALTMNGTSLWVADDGRDQQIKIFNSSGAQTGTFGDQGGYLGGTTPGAVGPTKLVRPDGIGFDSAGNIYILGSANSLNQQPNPPAGVDYAQDWSDDIREYNSGGTLIGELAATGSWDDNSVADAATDGQDFYSAINHYKFDYSKLTTGSAGGGQEWSWYSHTVDKVHYPHDPRTYAYFPTAIGIKTISGNKYLAVSEQYSSTLYLFHMTGEIAKPMAIFAGKWNPNIAWPNSPGAGGTWSWFDSNNNGEPDSGEFQNTPNGLSANDKWWQLDDAGNVWVAGGYFGYFPMQGVNANGQLTYSTAAFTGFATPAPFANGTIAAVQYDVSTDTLYLSGYTASQPAGANDPTSRLAGRVFARYGNWLVGGNRTADWSISFPYAAYSNNLGTAIRAWTVTGGKLFAGLEETQCNQGICGTGNSAAGVGGTFDPNTVLHSVYVYDASAAGGGAALGEMQPGAETGGYLSWIDENQAFSAYHRTSTGEYITAQEDQIGTKQTMMRGLLQNFTQY